MPRALYQIVYFNDRYIHILDAGGGRRMTITNDAEAVVAEVASLYPGRRIFYTDTDGQIDELLHNAGKFAGFAPGPIPQDLKS